MPLSGSLWVPQFPTSKLIDDLSEPFRTNVGRFVSALRAASASVIISATFRPPERVYLMHHSFAVAREGVDPNNVPAMTSVDIQWLHTTAGSPDHAASKAAADQMVQGYGIVFKPALGSRHEDGRAIDMTITWETSLVIPRADGTIVTIAGIPRNGAENTQLHQVGASYGVIKLLTDHPHWSSDGH